MTGFAARFCLLVAFATTQTQAHDRQHMAGRGFLAPVSGIRAEEVRANLQENLALVLAGKTERMQFIEASIAQTFQALPKTSAGRLGPHAVRYILRSYFSKEHGWSLIGLDPNEIQDSNSSAEILHAGVPALMEAVLEAHEHGEGLTLSEAVALAAALERLVFAEVMQVLHVAYKMNGYQEIQHLNTSQVREVLLSFLAFYHQTADENVADGIAGHTQWKMSQKQEGYLILEEAFSTDSLSNYEFATKHVAGLEAFTSAASRRYSFDATSQIVATMAEGMGRWHDESCQVMKNKLESLDTTGTGRVPLSAFYNAEGVPMFDFDEHIEELRALSLVDETVPNRPMVRIANYILSPSNCEELSEYYDACCLTACASIMDQLEARFMAPTVQPELLLEAVLNISHSPDEDFHISASPLLGSGGSHLRKSLQSIAAKHGGLVPLHGRLFATWLHFAFPRDCPLPRNTEAAAVEAPKALQRYMSEMELLMPASEDGEQTWTDDEDSAVVQELQASLTASPSQFRATLRLLAMVAVCGAVLQVAAKYYDTLVAVTSGDSRKAKKNDDYNLPLVF